MLEHLPPLKALSAFIVATRTLHFGQAAQQLHITQSAVSHQIKNLETHLGCKLFYREGNRLLLTEQGKHLADSVNPAFDQINATCRALSGELEAALQFGVSSAFAVHRLTPEVTVFCEKHKGLDLRIRMLTCNDDPVQLNLDLMLLEKPLEHVAYECEQLKIERYFAVATPQLASQLVDANIEQWPQWVSLIDLQGINCWQMWYETQGFNLEAMPQLQFGNTLLMLKAALSNQGIALLGESLIKQELLAGDLVKLAEQPFSFAHDGYYFCYHQARRNDPKLRLVKYWLQRLL